MVGKLYLTALNIYKAVGRFNTMKTPIPFFMYNF